MPWLIGILKTGFQLALPYIIERIFKKKDSDKKESDEKPCPKKEDEKE